MLCRTPCTLSVAVCLFLCLSLCTAAWRPLAGSDQLFTCPRLDDDLVIVLPPRWSQIQWLPTEQDDTDPAHILASRHLQPHIALLWSSLHRGAAEACVQWTPVKFNDGGACWGPDAHLAIGFGGLQAKVGIGAIDLSGLGHSSAYAYVNYDLALLWTEWNPVGIDRHQRLLGGSLTLFAFAFQFQFELYCQISSGDRQGRGLFVGSVGLGV